MNEIDDELERNAELLEDDAAYADTIAEEKSQNEDQQEEDREAQDEAEEEEPKKPFYDVLDWAACIIYAVALMLVINLFFFRSITVRGDSMNDTLVNNDQVVLTNFFYTPSYGDIVVIQANKLKIQDTDIYGEAIIKRVIAVAGDTLKIDFDKGEVYRNGELLSEDYIKDLTHYYRPYGYVESNVEYVVPENRVFVMGDNRNVSNDSRNLQDVGFIDVDLIIGKVIARYSPIKDFKWL